MGGCSNIPLGVILLLGIPWWNFYVHFCFVLVWIVVVLWILFLLSSFGFGGSGIFSGFGLFRERGRE